MVFEVPFGPNHSVILRYTSLRGRFGRKERIARTSIFLCMCAKCHILSVLNSNVYGNFGLCNSAGIISQIFSSSGWDKCISVSRPEQVLVTGLSASVVSSLFLMLKDYFFIKYFLLACTPDTCAFKCDAWYTDAYSRMDFIAAQLCSSGAFEF